MFEYCETLPSLNLTSFNTANVKTMEMMFYGCKSLKSVRVTKRFVVNKNTNTSNMFRYGPITSVKGFTIVR